MAKRMRLGFCYLVSNLLLSSQIERAVSYMAHKESFWAKRTATKVRREARKLAKRLEKEKIRIDENLYAIYIEEKLWLLEAQNAPFYLAEKCLRCGKRRAIIKQSGYCVPCHLLYYKELVPCPVYTQLKEMNDNGYILNGKKMEGKCSALRERFSSDKFGDFLIEKNATICPHCNRVLICSKCGHQIPIHLNSCYRCDDKRSFGQKLKKLLLTKKELSTLIKALPEGTEVSEDEFVSEALIPASSGLIEFEILSTFSIYCAIKEALEKEPLDPFLVDFYRGSGWLPKSSIPVRIEPPFMQMSKKEILPIVIEHEASKFALFSEKRDNEKMRCFNIVLSNTDNVTPKLAESFWSALNVIRYPVSFEIIGSGRKQKVVFQLICQEEDKDYIANLLNNTYQTINPAGSDCDYLLDGLKPSYQEKLQHGSCFGVSFGLSEHWENQIRKYTSFSLDALSEIVENLGTLSQDEVAIFQALIMPAREPWAKTIERLEHSAKEKI
ncbi:MAG: hypothetical protein ACE5GI_10055, partial [Candidatus Aminicenantales bacterium]